MNFLATLRYLIFAVFIVCNAILSSVAVWNSSLVPSSSRQSHTDTYIVVVGALGLALTFTIIFVELVRRNAFTSRVWFEILWTTTFFGLDLAGAAILTVAGLDDVCAPTQSKKITTNSTWDLCFFSGIAGLHLVMHFHPPHVSHSPRHANFGELEQRLNAANMGMHCPQLPSINIATL